MQQQAERLWLAVAGSLCSPTQLTKRTRFNNEVDLTSWTPKRLLTLGRKLGSEWH